jgi:hypothetical protein
MRTDKPTSAANANAKSVRRRFTTYLKPPKESMQAVGRGSLKVTSKQTPQPHEELAS